MSIVAKSEYTISPLSDGSKGDAGRGVVSITPEYYLSTSKTTQSGGSWATTPPTWVSGKYLWTRNKIVYSNPSGTEYTAPSVSSEWEAANEVAIHLSQEIEDANASAEASDQEKRERLADIDEAIAQLNSAVAAAEESASSNQSQTNIVIDGLRATIKALETEAERLRTGVAELEANKVTTDQYIKNGLLYVDDMGIPRYGVAIGENLTTVTDDQGRVVIERRALATTITSDRISFWRNGQEVIYISEGKVSIKRLAIGPWEFRYEHGLTLLYKG